MFVERIRRVREAMSSAGVDALALSVGADLPWLVGYEAMALERLTMLVLRASGPPVLVIPRLEQARVSAETLTGAGVEVASWGETDDPVGLVEDLLGGTQVVAIGDRTWARFLLELQSRDPRRRWLPASAVVGPVRAVKTPAEVDHLRRAGRAVDSVMEIIRGGGVRLVGRTEAEVAVEVGALLIAAGHHRTNFVIVASGPNAASPHHEPGDRVIAAGEGILFDLGGTVLDEAGVGWCSDSTRCVWTGPVDPDAARAYEALTEAHRAAVATVAPGVPAGEVDAAARRVLAAHGLDGYFIHRTGHGIGVEEHEAPWIVAGDRTALEVGHCFSIEPGVYLPGRFGFRLEDIVVCTADGAVSLNSSGRDLAVVGPGR